MKLLMVQVALLLLAAYLHSCLADTNDIDIDMQGAAVRSSPEAAGDENDIELGDDDTDNNNNNDDNNNDNDGSGNDAADGETAKEGYGKQPTKKVYVPVYVPEKDKKKMKIISVDKGFYVSGGMQLFGKFKSLKHCMKACAVTPTCFQGDYNPWLHKCYQHTNYTACQTMSSHPQYIHFSKVPCSVIDAPSGTVTLGTSMANGIEQKGIEDLANCIKKCAAAGAGIPATVQTVLPAAVVGIPSFLAAVASDARQTCFAIDYDFATHKCFFFQQNIIQVAAAATNTLLLHCALGRDRKLGNSQGLRPNPTVIHITFCPKTVG